MDPHEATYDDLHRHRCFTPIRQPMKLNDFLPLAVVCLAVLSLCASETHAGGLGAREGVTTATDDDNGNGADTSEAQNEHPLPGPSTVANIHPALSSADSNGVEQQTALGPQYRLNGNAELGGTSEKPDLSAMTKNPDADRYTFGLRMTF